MKQHCCNCLVDFSIFGLDDGLGGGVGALYLPKGSLACVVCVNKTSSVYLMGSMKIVYMHHRRFVGAYQRHLAMTLADANLG